MARAVGHAVAAVTTKISGNARTSADAGTSVVLCIVGERGPATPAPPLLVGRREGLSACFTALTLSIASPSLAAILEADDDEELLEKVKNDRKKRLQRQGVISSSAKETGYLQELVYKLSKAGKAIENNDFSEASSVLGPSTHANWIQNVNIAFTKLTSSPEEKSEVDAFNSSLAFLISSGAIYNVHFVMQLSLVCWLGAFSSTKRSWVRVLRMCCVFDKHDIESSKSAFVLSASALEKWVESTGLVGLLKGL